VTVNAGVARGDLFSNLTAGEFRKARGEKNVQPASVVDSANEPLLWGLIDS
jgi:hypothetical protein